MIKTICFSLTVCLLALSSYGCATIFRGGGSQDVKFVTEPEGAEIHLNGDLKGKTPAVIELDPKDNYRVEFRKEGYEDSAQLFKGTPHGGWVAMNA